MSVEQEKTPIDRLEYPLHEFKNNAVGFAKRMAIATEHIKAILALNAQAGWLTEKEQTRLKDFNHYLSLLAKAPAFSHAELSLEQKLQEMHEILHALPEQQVALTALSIRYAGMDELLGQLSNYDDKLKKLISAQSPSLSTLISEAFQRIAHISGPVDKIVDQLAKPRSSLQQQLSEHWLKPFQKLQSRVVKIGDRINEKVDFHMKITDKIRNQYKNLNKKSDVAAFEKSIKKLLKENAVLEDKFAKSTLDPKASSKIWQQQVALYQQLVDIYNGIQLLEQMYPHEYDKALSACQSAFKPKDFEAYVKHMVNKAKERGIVLNVLPQLAGTAPVLQKLQHSSQVLKECTGNEAFVRKQQARYRALLEEAKAEPLLYQAATNIEHAHQKVIQTTKKSHRNYRVQQALTDKIIISRVTLSPYRGGLTWRAGQLEAMEQQLQSLHETLYGEALPIEWRTTEVAKPHFNRVDKRKLEALETMFADGTKLAIYPDRMEIQPGHAGNAQKAIELVSQAMLVVHGINTNLSISGQVNGQQQAEFKAYVEEQRQLELERYSSDSKLTS